MEQVRLVFLTDARAKYDGNVETDEELDWVAVAREDYAGVIPRGVLKVWKDLIPCLY